MPALQLPDLAGLTDTRGGVLGALGQIASALPADPSTLTAGLAGSTASLHATLQIDPAGLTGGVSSALAGLASAVPVHLPVLDGLGAGLTEALGAIEPLRQALTSNGQLLDLKGLALARTGDPAQRITDLLGELTKLIPADGLVALETFVTTVTTFEAAIPSDPAQIATFLGHGFLGVPADLLAPTRAALDGLLATITALVPKAQVDALTGLVPGLVAQLTALETEVRAVVPGDAASYVPALSTLAAYQASLHAYTTSVSSLASGLTASLTGLDTSALLAPIEAALAAVPELHVPDTGAFLNIVIEPLRQVSLLADTVTPEQVAAQLRGWTGFVEHDFADGGLAELEAMVRQPFEQIGHAIEGIHLEVIREAFRTALGGVASVLGPATDAIAGIRSTLVGALDGVSAAIGPVTSAATEVQHALETVAAAVKAAAGAVSLKGLHDDALKLIGELSGGVASFVTDAGAAVKALHDLIGELGQIDLEAAAAGAVDAIGQITKTLAGIDVAPLPDAVLSELKSALTGLLGSISLQPVHDALGSAIVPTGPLDAFTAAFAEATKALSQFSPSGLLEPLVAPFNDITAKLTALHPADLLDPVIHELEEASAKLDGLDPAKLLAGLDAPLQEARTALASVAPDKLLAPLHAPFADLIGLVGKLDVTPFLDELDTMTSQWLQQAVSGLSGLATPFGSAGSTTAFVDSVSGKAAIGGEFGFRPGDILRPVQDLYEKVTGLIGKIPAGVLIAAFEQIRSGLVDTLDALSPGNLQAHVHTHVEGLLAGFDVGEHAALLGDLLPSYGRVALAVDAIDPAAVGGGAAAGNHAQLLTLTVSADPESVLGPLRATLGSLRGGSLASSGSLELGGIAAHYGTVAGRLSALLPDFLRQPVTIEGLNAHLDAANPKHLADAVNAEFDALAVKLIGFAEVFTAELPKVAEQLKGRMEEALAGMLRRAFAAVYDPLRAQLMTLDPAGLEADLNASVYAPIRSALDSLSLAGIVGDSQLTAKLAAARSGMHGVLDALQVLKSTVGGAYDAAVADVLAVSPASLESDLQAAYAPVATGLAGLDFSGISDELKAQFQRLADQTTTVLQEVLDALKAMIAAIPGGIEGVHAEVDLSVRA
jgi:hypothetical protein